MIHISKRAMEKFNEAQPGGPKKQFRVVISGIG